MDRDKSSGDFPACPPPPPPLPPRLLAGKGIPAVSSCGDFREDDVASLDKAIGRVTDVNLAFRRKPFFSRYTDLRSQLQEGPKCGLVALSIATSKTNFFKSADELFEEALAHGYTTQGEMYSCRNMARLIQKTTEFSTFIIEGGITSHLDCILSCLTNKGFMLVPYDADRNHAPCCKKGHSAHWAVISGVVVFARSEEPGDVRSVHVGGYPACRCSEDGFFAAAETDRPPRIVRDGPRTYLCAEEGDAAAAAEGEIYLAGKQGKSRHLALWSLRELAESNANLTELSEQQKTKNFAVPDGGVAAGLRNQAILLNLR
ncbi:UNVERIFIED_CONTAM: hypothetical protein PYX00_007219 [Menopon gallinae]|uniref:Actin maturation protease n=1 Tax=Menopon gallinae TaxID=328185 RepID=A0AAW2HID0_9NEOP